jgi:hypothetical protein
LRLLVIHRLDNQIHVSQVILLTVQLDVATLRPHKFLALHRWTFVKFASRIYLVIVSLIPLIPHLLLIFSHWVVFLDCRLDRLFSDDAGSSTLSLEKRAVRVAW